MTGTSDVGSRTAEAKAPRISRGSHYDPARTISDADPVPDRRSRRSTRSSRRCARSHAEAAEPPEVVGLHPATPTRAGAPLAHVRTAPAKGIRAAGTEAAQVMRALIEPAMVWRDPVRPGGVANEISGRPTQAPGPQTPPQRTTAV